MKRRNKAKAVVHTRTRPSDLNVFYHGAQYLLKTTDMGRTWKEISPDLTRNEKEKQGKGGGPYTNEAVRSERFLSRRAVPVEDDRHGPHVERDFTRPHAE